MIGGTRTDRRRDRPDRLLARHQHVADVLDPRLAKASSRAISLLFERSRRCQPPTPRRHHADPTTTGHHPADTTITSSTGRDSAGRTRTPNGAASCRRRRSTGDVGVGRRRRPHRRPRAPTAGTAATRSRARTSSAVDSHRPIGAKIRGSYPAMRSRWRWRTDSGAIWASSPSSPMPHTSVRRRVRRARRARRPR